MNSHAIDLSVLLIASLVVIGKVVVPIARAFAKRIEGNPANTGLLSEVEELRTRVSELEAQETRLLELEERLDFAERLLTKGRSPDLGDASPPRAPSPAAH